MNNWHSGWLRPSLVLQPQATEGGIAVALKRASGVELGISASTLVIADATPGFGQPTQFFDQLVHYDLSQLSSYAQKVP